MPRKALFKKEEIVSKALNLVRQKGQNALTARELGAALGSLSRPIFTVFKNMDEVNAEVKRAAQQLFADYVADVSNYVPAFKEFGLRLIRFAQEENHLFRFLFLQKDSISEGIHFVTRELLSDLESSYGLSEEQTAMLFRQMWIFTCGMAVLSANEPQNYTLSQVSEMLTCQFVSTLSFIQSGRPIPNIEPHLRGEGENPVLPF